MRRAVALAARGRATTLPNPVVGCVLLSPDGDPVGEGWHEVAGGPHAEVAALAGAGARARGATAVVTLEPCRHTGRTGPCTEALLDAGVARVVVGSPDPTAEGGGGVGVLRAAGVDVETGVLADETDAVNEPWLTAVRRGRPYVTWKVATTLDGRVAAADGTSRWITGEAARADVHRLRAEVDTVLVGVGTVLADDPALTVRGPDGGLAARQPLRVVADTSGRTPATARVRDDAAPTWVATAAEVGTDASGRLDLDALLRRLFRRERRHVLLEGGPRLAGTCWRAGLVDRVVAYVAPALLGAGPAAVEDAGIGTIADAARLQLVDVTRLGDDVRLTLRP
ncbi:MAG: bifunctional diaminohydroxyphosphoribosylaminopyrimidine deaminase/5-amino-6-(5-phosphoribosylamino)uracil reductase RibD [Actinomycetes bacterium]